MSETRNARMCNRCGVRPCNPSLARNRWYICSHCHDQLPSRKRHAQRHGASQQWRRSMQRRAVGRAARLVGLALFARYTGYDYSEDNNANS